MHPLFFSSDNLLHAPTSPTPRLGVASSSPPTKRLVGTIARGGCRGDGTRDSRGRGRERVRRSSDLREHKLNGVIMERFRLPDEKAKARQRAVTL